MSNRWTKKEREENKTDALKRLHELLKPESKVYVQVAHVSRSGMSRDLRLFVVKDGELENITWWACWATDEIPRVNRNGQRVMRVGGCGMDMCFAAVYQLGIALFGREMPCPVCLGKGELKRSADEDGKSVMHECWRCLGAKTVSGGYALKKESL